MPDYNVLYDNGYTLFETQLLGYTFRQVVSAGNLAVTASHIRVVFFPRSSNTTIRAWIGLQSTSGDAWDIDPATLVQLTVGGSGDIVLPANTLVATDDVPLVVDRTRAVVISADVTSGYYPLKGPLPSGLTLYRKQVANAHQADESEFLVYNNYAIFKAIEGYHENLRQPVLAGVDHTWIVFAEHRVAETSHRYSLKMGADLRQAWVDAPVIRGQMGQPYGDAGILAATLLHRWRDAVLLAARLDQPYALPASLLTALAQHWALTLDQVNNELTKVWDLYDKSIIRQQFSQNYWIELEGNVVVSELTDIIIPTIATNDRQLTSVISLNLESSSDLFVITATVGLSEYSEWKSLNKGDKVFISNVLGTTFTLIVESLMEDKTAESREYVVELISETIKLDLPYADMVTEELSGMASQIVSQLTTTTLTQWNAVDWFIPSGLLFLDNEAPISGIRKVTGAIKAVIGTTPGGTLTVEPRYKKSVLEINQNDVELELLETFHVVSSSYNTVINPGYNSITVSDNAIGSNNTIRVKTERVSEFVTDIIVETSPWRETYLSHSGGVYISIQDMFIEEVQETDELVEFIEGEGATSRTIHEISKYNWRERDLGVITHEQSGALRSSVLDDSLLLITYFCKQQRWRVKSSEEGPTQFIIEDTNG